MLHLQLLGPLVVVDDSGRDLTPAGARERNGLATLAIVAPDPLSTDRLAAELYRERDAADPRNAVQAMISRLRRALGQLAGSVETTANGYRLVDVTLDVDEAEQLLRMASTETDLALAVDLLSRAEGLWHGPTLFGVDGELIDAERLRLEGLKADALDHVLDRRLNEATPNTVDGDLLAALEGAVRDHPLRERRWELLMLAQYRAGRQADALRSFQRARTALAEQLGLDPGPGLATLEQQILTHDPALDHPKPRTEGPPEAPSDPDPTAERRPGSLPSGTLTILFSDVEGSVRRWEDEPADTAQAIEQLHQTWGRSVEKNGGIMVKSTGDGIMAVFTTAAAAVIGATDALASTQEESKLRVRAAIHTGALEPVADDYRGPVINRCARLLDLANGGQILVSGPAAELARGDLTWPIEPEPRSQTPPAGVGLRELGSHWLRDVPEPVAVWQVTGPGLQASFPPLRSEDVSSLPRPRNRLIGRDGLIDRVTGLVEGEPVVTLLGPGGIGKTSTALASAWEVIGGRPVVFVDLARVDDPTAVPHRLADAVAPVHDDDDARTPDQRIADRLATSTDLVVIDNAEHVLDAVATTVDAVLSRQLKGSFLVTSRQPLGLADEVIVGVPPLEVPVDGDDLASTGESPAVKLFVERARSSHPDFRLPDGLLPVVAHICRRLDGIPLAIELAAGRANLLSIDDIAARLDDQLRLLRQVRSKRDRRHQSLEAVVAWSVEQLSDDANQLYNRLSVMTGSFGLEGVERLITHCGLSQVDVLDALDELSDASLISVEPGGSRFRMLEPIRQYAAAELERLDQEESTRRAHVRWLIELAEDGHYRRDRSRPEAQAKLDLEGDQILAALSWIIERDQVDLAGPITFPIGFWFLTRDARAGERVLRRVLEMVERNETGADDRLNWALTVLGFGIATAAHPRSEVAERSIEAIAVLDEHRHPDRGVARLAAVFAQTGGTDIDLPMGLLDEADRVTPADDLYARALIDQATMIMWSLVMYFEPDRIDTDLAIERGLRAIEVFRELGETWSVGTTMAELGRLHQRLGNVEAAEQCYLESIELFDGSDNHGNHYVLSELGRIASERGEHERAVRLHREAMRIARIDGNDGCLALALAGLAHAAEAEGETETAITHYREALSLSRDSIIELGRAEWEAALADLERSTS